MHSIRECRHIRLISTVGGGKRQWLSAAFWQRVLSSQVNDALSYQRQRTYVSLASSSATLLSSPSSSLLTPTPALLHHPATFSSSFSDSKNRNDDSRKPISILKLSSTSSLSPSLHVFQSRQSSGIPHSGSVPIEASSSSPSTTSDSARQQKLVKDDTWRLLKLVGPEKGSMSAAVGLLAVSSAVTMSVPFLMGKVIDIINSHVETGNALDALNPISQVLVGVFIAGALANGGRVYLIQSSGHRIVSNLRVSVLSSIMKKDLSFFDKTRTGELVSRLSSDTTIVGQSLTQNLSDGLRSILMCAVSGALMVYISPQLSGLSLITVAPVAAFSIVYGKRLRNFSKQLQDRVASSTQLAEERISNIRTVKSFAQELEEISQYQLKNNSVLDIAYKDSAARAVFFGVNALVGNLIVLVVFYYGGMMMQNSTITVGEISSFLVYAAYMGFGLGGLSTFYSELMRGVGASTRLWNLIDAPTAQTSPPLDGGIIPSREVLEGDILFQNLAFAYPSRPDIQIFKDLNLLCPAGKVTAIVGKSGTGKSTIASLLLSLYSPNSGSIRLRDVDIKGINPSWLRENIGIVAQEPVLFSTTIADNIRYGMEAFGVDVIEAAKKANAHGFISSLTDGYDTLIGERGITLSGGQKQRVAIARAILKNPSILVLDEATSALDSESEGLIRDALERFTIGRTVIVIAHRLSTIRNADNIVVLSEGIVAESGTYSELMRNKSGIFRSLMQKQALTSED